MDIVKNILIVAAIFIVTLYIFYKFVAFVSSFSEASILKKRKKNDAYRKYLKENGREGKAKVISAESIGSAVSYMGVTLQEYHVIFSVTFLDNGELYNYERKQLRVPVHCGDKMMPDAETNVWIYRDDPRVALFDFDMSTDSYIMTFADNDVIFDIDAEDSKQ
jgi:hypothetical protein